MTIPRYRGYGFRNIGGWEVRDNCAKAGRNLNIVSSGVLLYLVSGADVKSLSVGGASVDIDYPTAFLIFGLAAFVWLGYRFLLAYRDAVDTDPWWHLYMRDIVLVNYPVSKFVSDELSRRYAPKRASYSMSHKSVVEKFGLLRSTVVIPTVQLNQEIVGRDVKIEIPLGAHLRAHLYCFPRYLVSNSDIADMWIPWLLYALAIAGLVAEWMGVGPAGLYGLLPLKPH